MLAAGVAIAWFATATVGADESLSSVTRGGRLYDNWLSEIRERAPGQHHPAYPVDLIGAVDDADSWRCPTCHGWDYRTAVRFKLVDGLHGIDSTDVQAFRDVLDTKKDQHHAAPE